MMTKKAKIKELKRMCQDYSNIVDKNFEIMEKLLSMVDALKEKNMKFVDFDGDDCPNKQLAKILVGMSSDDWMNLNIELRLHLLNDHSDDWMNHGKLAARFGTIESIICRVAQAEATRKNGGIA